MLYSIYHTEKELIQQFANGESNAFTAVYQEFQERIYFYARRYVQDPSEAEDITADVFVKLWHKKETFESMEAVSGFLYVSVRNKCIDFLRHAKMKKSKKAFLVHQLHEEETDFSIEQVRIELMNLIQAEVDKLPLKMKEVFQLSFHEGLKPVQIARLLRLSVQTVSNQKTTAIKQIRMALSGKKLLPIHGTEPGYSYLLMLLPGLDLLF